jgi:DNA-binding transcriptional LysR family regulator
MTQLAEGDLDLAVLSLPMNRRDLVAEALLTGEMVLEVPADSGKWRQRRRSIFL